MLLQVKCMCGIDRLYVSAMWWCAVNYTIFVIIIIPQASMRCVQVDLAIFFYRFFKVFVLN